MQLGAHLEAELHDADGATLTGFPRKAEADDAIAALRRSDSGALA